MSDFKYTPLFSSDEINTIKKLLDEPLANKIIASLTTVESIERDFAEKYYEEQNGILVNRQYGFKIKDGKIYKATDKQLYSFWLDKWSDFLSYQDYKEKCINKGTIVEEDI